MAKVSIIVPNFNHVDFLSQRLESIFTQTYKNFEVILLDDCSTDNSLEILEQYRSHPKVSHYVINDKNSGSPFRQWYKGIKLAKGEYIWIAESDDYAEPNFLEELAKILDIDKSVALAFCKSNWVDNKNRISTDLTIRRQGAKEGGKSEIRNHLVFGNSIQNVSAVLFRADSLKKASPKYAKYLE